VPGEGLTFHRSCSLPHGHVAAAASASMADSGVAAARRDLVLALLVSRHHPLLPRSWRSARAQWADGEQAGPRAQLVLVFTT